MEQEEVIIASCGWVVETLTKALEAKQCQVECSFDWSSTLHSNSCCSNSDTVQECFIVLFVYEEWHRTPPVIFMAYGRGEITKLHIRTENSVNKLPTSIVSALDDTISAASKL